MIRVEHNRQSVAVQLHYGRHEADSSHHLVEGVMERLRTTRSPRRQDASAVPQNGMATYKGDVGSLLTANDRAGGRCDLPTPMQSPVSRPCSLTEEIPPSAKSGAGPSIRGGALGMKRRSRVGFDIEDVGSDASGSKSNKSPRGGIVP